MIAASCLICIEKITSKEGVSALDCGHIFHSMCTESWFKQSKTCPVCRKKIKTYVKKLFFSQLDNTQNDSDEVQYNQDEEILKCKVSELQIIIFEMKTALDVYEKSTSENASRINDMKKQIAGHDKSLDVLRQSYSKLSNSYEALKKKNRGTEEDLMKLRRRENKLTSQLASMASYESLVKECADEVAQKVQQLEVQTANKDPVESTRIAMLALIKEKKAKDAVLEKLMCCQTDFARSTAFTKSLQTEMTEVRKELVLVQRENLAMRESPCMETLPLKPCAETMDDAEELDITPNQLNASKLSNPFQVKTVKRRFSLSNYSPTDENKVPCFRVDKPHIITINSTSSSLQRPKIKKKKSFGSQFKSGQLKLTAFVNKS